MRVLLFTNLFPTPTEPTRGLFKLHLARALLGHCDLTVINPLPWFPSHSWLRRFGHWYRYATVPERYSFMEVDVHCPKYLLLPKWPGKHAWFMQRGISQYIRRLHQKKPFDVINSHWLYPDGCVAQVTAEQIGSPHVPTGCGSDVNTELLLSAKRGQIIRLLTRADHIVTVSRQLRDELMGCGVAPERVSAISNGINMDQFIPEDYKASRERLGISTDVQHIVYVGRLSKEKGPEILLEAFMQIAKALPKTRLSIVGDGILRQKLERRWRDAGGAGQVAFVGQVANKDIKNWLSSADCFCLPSLSEGCPNVLLEALSCGIPVAASRVGAVEDFVNLFSGVMCKPGDSHGLSRAILTVLNSNWDRQVIRQSIAGQSWDATARQYIQVFQTTIDSAARKKGMSLCL